VVDTWFSTTCCCCQLESRTLHPTPSSGRIVNHRTRGCGACDFWSGLWLPKKKQLWNRSHEVGSLKKIGLDWRLSSWMKKWAAPSDCCMVVYVYSLQLASRSIKKGVGPKPGARRHVNTKVCHLLPRLQIAKFGQKIRLQIAFEFTPSSAAVAAEVASSSSTRDVFFLLLPGLLWLRSFFCIQSSFESTCSLSLLHAARTPTTTA